MTIRIECSDIKSEHVELHENGSVRFFGGQFDENNNAYIVSERQLVILAAMMEARKMIDDKLQVVA